MPSVEGDWAIVRDVIAKQAIAIKPLAIVLRMKVRQGFKVSSSRLDSVCDLPYENPRRYTMRMRSRPFRDLIIDPKTAKTLGLEADSRLLTSGNGTKPTCRCSHDMSVVEGENGPASEAVRLPKLDPKRTSCRKPPVSRVLV
jgi:hypothetical protein